MRSVEALDALAQPTRLEAFRLLVANEPEGLPAGRVAAALDVPHNTMSTHLAVLSRAGLVRSRREGRSIVFRADLETTRDLITFILRDCCGGRSEICGPLAIDLAACCQPLPDPESTT